MAPHPSVEAASREPANAKCADCDAIRPTWASVNLGVFICMDCAGHHRSLGVHISVCKSVTLDKWAGDWNEMLCKVGNASANKFYEAKALPGQKPSPGADRGTIGRWIDDKYVHRKYAAQGLDPWKRVKQGMNPHDMDKAPRAAPGARAAPTTAPTNAPAAAARTAPTANLLDFDSPSPAQAPAQAASSLMDLGQAQSPAGAFGSSLPGAFGAPAQNGASLPGAFGGPAQNGASLPGAFGAPAQNGASLPGAFGAPAQNGTGLMGAFGAPAQNGTGLMGAFGAPAQQSAGMAGARGAPMGMGIGMGMSAPVQPMGMGYPATLTQLRAGGSPKSTPARAGVMPAMGRRDLANEALAGLSSLGGGAKKPQVVSAPPGKGFSFSDVDPLRA